MDKITSKSMRTLKTFIFKAKKTKRKPVKNEYQLFIYKDMGKDKIFFVKERGNYARFLKVGQRIFWRIN